MPKRLFPETMIGEAQKAERIAAWQPDPVARHGWYKIALTWRTLAERAWADLASPAPVRVVRPRGAPWRT